ncbi:MAG: GNAT family N-acetyltransferase, partial [Microgenomates group bacterium]
YSTVRGKGLGVWFYTQLFDRFESQYVWAKVSADNITSIQLHEKLGFKQTSQPDDLNKIILVRDSHNN